MKMAKNLVAVIAALSGFIALTALLLLLLGYRPFVLMSGSMEPLYREGSLCLVNTHASLDDVEVGDVLVYRTADFLVLHRLVGITERGENGITAEMQGDANNVAQTVNLSRINYVGREAFTIPGLGRAVETLTSPFVWVAVFMFIVLASMPARSITRFLSFRRHVPQTSSPQEKNNG